MIRHNINIKQLSVRCKNFIWRSTPFTIPIVCLSIAAIGSDAWLGHQLQKKQKIDFQNAINRIAIQLENPVLLKDYANIDNNLINLLQENPSITCLVVTDNKGKSLSIATRTSRDQKPEVAYNRVPAECSLEDTPTEVADIRKENFTGRALISNRNIQLGTLTGHSLGSGDDRTNLRNIELVLFSAFGTIFIPTFGALALTSRNQLKREKEKLSKISSLIDDLEEAQLRTRSAFEGTNDGWWEWEISNDRSILSLKMRMLLEISASTTALMQQHQPGEANEWWKQFIAPEDHKRFRKFLNNVSNQTCNLENNSTIGTEIKAVKTRSKKECFLKIEAVVTEAINQKPSVVALVANDITREKEQQKSIQHLAFHDTLTGLMNRSAFEEEISRSTKGLLRKEYRLAVFMIDVDNFKFLNDSHGHTTGDQFLIEFANRLKSCVRPTDFVARLGGDEFVIITRFPMEDSSLVMERVKAMGEKLLLRLTHPYQLEACRSNNTCSIGICLDSPNSESASTLLDKADIALYKAKEIGRNRYFIYEKGMASAIISKANTSEKLRDMIETGETGLHLQPIVELSGGSALSHHTHHPTVVGHEALFRCPALKKPIPYLIECAEESGIIGLLTTSILDNIKSKIKEQRPGNKTYISINISPLQFLEPNFPDTFTRNLEDRSINPGLIRIEITETALLQDLQTTKTHMSKLKDHGVSFYLDDFGTGYSSIELLRKLPFSCLKLDRSYTKNLNKESGSELVKSIIDMSKAFNMFLIGEGVETFEQKRILESLGCEYAQGFLFNADGSCRQN